MIGTDGSPHNVPVAIIGLSALMPEAADLAGYWTNILQGADCLRDLPDGRWPRDLYLDTDKTAPDRAYVARGGFVPAVPFDPLAFGLPPKALASLDTSQVLGLLLAKAALEDAGYGPAGGRHARTGVILGLAGTTMKSLQDLRAALEAPVWENVLREQGFDGGRVADIAAAVRGLYPAWEENSFPGFLANVVAGRIANRFDLGGPAFAVDAACASSLCAIGLAMDTLAAGRADLMITGGLDTDNGPTAFLSFSKTPALSPTGAVRAFAADADGTMISEGIGLLVLKRLADAQRDGDRIYAVLRGYASTSDGRFKSIYAPRADGQARAVREALAAAGVAGETIGLIEAHGTGTEVGDMVEFQALAEVFGDSAAVSSIALGSVKSQIGHTKAAAGAASLIKTALALHYKVVPPTLNVGQPNPRLDLADSPLYLNTRTRPWLARADAPRRAGVSAFGFGGANVHVVLEEAPTAFEPLPLAIGPLGIVVDAADPVALAARCRVLAVGLQGADAAAVFADLLEAPAPAAERPRVGLVAANPAEAAEALTQAAARLDNGDADAWSLPSGVHYRSAALPEIGRGRLVALFPGQGSQYVGMGAALAVAFPQVRAALEGLDARYVAAGLAPLSSVVYPPPVFEAGAAADQEAVLRQTVYAQGGVGAVSLGLLRVLESAGLRPDIVAGHSFGELTALLAGGALDEATYLDLVLARGRALTPPADLADAGALLAVNMGAAVIEAVLDDLPGVHLANANAPGQSVLGGPVAAIEAAERRLTGLGHAAVRLPVAAAFHTPCVGYAQAPWREALATAALTAPCLPVASNRSGGFHGDDVQGIREALAGQPFSAVRFCRNIEAIHDAGGRMFVEIGPRAVLTRLVGSTLAGRPHLALSLDPGRGDGERRLREAVVQLRVAGLPLTEPRPAKRPPRPAPLPDHGGVIWVDGQSIGATERRQNVERKLAELAKRDQRHPVLPATNPAVHPTPSAARPPRNPEPTVSHPTRSPEPTVWHSTGNPEPMIWHPTGNPAPVGALPSGRLSQTAPNPELGTPPGGMAPTPSRIAHGGALLQVPRHGTQASVGALASGRSPAEAANPSMAAGPSLIQRALDLEDATLAAHRDFLALQTAQAHLLGQMHAHGAHDALIERVCTQQAEVTRLHTDFLTGQRQHAHSLLLAGAPTAGRPAETAPSPVATPETPAPSTEPDRPPDMLPTLLGIVAEATGYPAEFLDPAMDMEADLGIDSIKRVEILAALRESVGEAGRLAGPLPKTALASARSLQALADALARHVQETAMPMEADDEIVTTNDAATASATTPGKTPPGITESHSRHPASEQSEAAGGLHGPGNPAVSAVPTTPDTLRTRLTAIVAEKTGYPADMLAPDLDIEADLGIDSIKRVEILAVLREVLGAGTVWPDRSTLAAARTLGAMAQLLAEAAAPEDTAAGGTQPAADPDEHVAARPPAADTPAAVTTGRLIWEHLPPPMPDRRLPGGTVIVYGDGGPLTLELAHALEQAGATAVVLQPPVARMVEPPETVHCLPLADTERATLDTVLARTERLFGPIAAAIHCWPCMSDTTAVPIGSTAPLACALDLATLMDTRLAQAKAAAFLTVAPAAAPAAAAGLRGLVRTLTREWPTVRVRAVEIAADMTPVMVAAAILAELTDGTDMPPVVTIDARTRRQLRFTPHPLSDTGELPVGPGDRVLVTGGGRGITADCADALATASGCRLLLLGRTVIDEPEPDWAVGTADADLRSGAIAALGQGGRPTLREVEAAVAPILARRAVCARLAALRAAGIDADYRAVDVADASALRTALAGVGPIAGVIHGAGALADRRIGDKRPEDFAAVFRPKVGGLSVLLSVLDPAALKLLALFSSTAASFGNAGQSDYAMANAVLDRTAERLAETLPATRIVAIAWGPWRAGMVTPALARRFVERGIRPIEPDAGRALFLAALRQPDGGQVIVGDDLSAASGPRAPRRFSLAETPVLADHMIDGHPVVPAAWPLAWMLAQAEADGARVAVVEDFRVLKGLILDDGQTGPLTLRLSATGTAVDAGIFAANAVGPDVPHYSARLVTGPVPACPYTADTGGPGEAGDPTAYLDGPIAYGPAFRGVLRVTRLDAGGVTITCTLPIEVREGPRNPLAYDLATHALLVWLQAQHGAGCLPSRVGRIVWPAMPVGAGPLSAQASIRACDDERLVADLALFDDAGKAVLWIDGFEGIVVGRDHPLALRAAARRA